ncbi:lytic transglycosylase [Natronospira bacteriovora]|uniref:LysM peptidoglycan-binding domain-containing protein n=1 Tax=Natronospira bacteriovora TaxID=3069753 RepID=A0ABU0W4K5_9GAMM|nr:LysM peptidoglycan-binding domain-containing protein [Natronospira sp. AB-CW4]MDQ2068952.1 LysM peptidoglycan-binding domain-containing protein [Natronospira sp. AB-CW4]
MSSASPLCRFRRIGLVVTLPLTLGACASLPFFEREDSDVVADIGLEPALELDPPVELDLTTHIDWRDHARHLLDEDGELKAPEDVWERMRRGFAMESRENNRIDPQIRWHQRYPGYMDRVATRAEPFLTYILDEIEARGMPTEMALVPIVESAYDPFAYSHGRAAGMWQFIPSTGRHFGLKQNWWYDGRRDFIAATDAALTYLESLANRFGGDYELALAAYNAGGGNVSRAMRTARQRGQDTDYWSLRLPRETMHYVPKVLALREIIAHPEEYGVSLRPIDNEPRIAVVELDGQIDLALAARLADMDIDEVYRLNAGFNRWATDPDGPHRLVVPIDRKEAFEQALAELDPGDRIRWVRHRIESGESLNRIARNYNTTVELLQDVNELRSHVIRAGDHLLVPQPMADAASYSGTVSQRIARIQSTQRGNRERVNHSVQPGESFWSIAQRYGVGVRQLAQWNGMAPGDTLRAGQTLTVWVSDASVAQLSPMRGGPSDRERRVNYQVRSGDSLARIASRFGVTVSDLLRWNSLNADDYLQPGQRLTIIVDVTNSHAGS